MINPDPFTRYTLSDVLRHPWMSCNNNSNSGSEEDDCSSSNNVSSKSRRSGVCYNNADSVRCSLLELNFCSCSCHKGNGCDAGHKHGRNNDCAAATARDSVISRHCEDCDDFRANDPDVMHRRQLRLASRRNSNSSVGSSGYGSEYGSQYLPTTPSPAACDTGSNNMGLLGFEMLMGGAGGEPSFRSTTPRKSSACSVATIKAKNSFQRCSVPARPSTMMREYASDDEEVVFV